MCDLTVYKRDAATNKLTLRLPSSTRKAHIIGQNLPKDIYIYNLEVTSCLWTPYAIGHVIITILIGIAMGCVDTPYKLSVCILFLCLPYSNGAIHRRSYHAVFLWMITNTCYLTENPYALYHSHILQKAVK